jgi:multidrug efflux pump
VTPEGATVEIPEGADSARKYMTADGTGLVEREEDGVTVVSRQAAE